MTNLHPAVLMPDWPDHPAWLLRNADTGSELIGAVLDVLCSQMDAIQEVTLRRQHRTRKAEYERVAHLIALPGATTNELMGRLAPWTRDGEARIRAWQSDAVAVAADAETQRCWLDGLRKLGVDDVLDGLAGEYGVPTRKNYSVPEDVLPFEEQWLTARAPS